VAAQMDPKTTEPTIEQLKALADAAWEVRESAYTFGHTKVGAAVLSADGEMFIGCNVEHRFRSHDVHAEVNAITSMISSGRTALVAVVIAAERERFTPCGSCMDWIYQFGGPTCRVGYQSNPGGEITILSAEELMPYYPR
jgi:cytidine deaminase